MLGEPTGSFTDLHHDRVASLLQERVTEVGILPLVDYLLGQFESVADVEVLLGSPAVHHSRTISRRMSSSMPLLSDP